jgi:extracellular factor (EF) 3-hydroxypalmitic acid methyl ester biosynthesis protein
MSALTAAILGAAELRRSLLGIDEALTSIASGKVLEGMGLLIRLLKETRMARAHDKWRDEDCPALRSHPLREWVHQDPFTSHSFRKPRGYAGDAQLLDHIYGRGPMVAQSHSSTTAGQLYLYTTNAPSCRAVRYRRELMAKLIDEAASKRKVPRILSIAAGHLREVELSRSAEAGRFGRFVALDQDDSSLEVIRADYGHLGVEPINMSVKSLLRGGHFSGDFDLVYAAGLFDYLSEPVARKLVRIMFDSLRPGGTMMYANFLPHIDDAGYMEALMDWWLIYRTQQEMAVLASAIPAEEIRSLSCTKDPDNNIGFVTIHRV